MGTRIVISGFALGLSALFAAAPGALGAAGSCCKPDGTCIITADAPTCTNSTNKGVFVGNASCTAGWQGDCYPDVFVWSLQDATRWGSAVVGGKTIDAFSFGTYSCNQGTTNLLWQQSTPFHPIISQDMFRIMNGRIEHIGMSWLKNGFFALSNVNAGCGTCPFPTNGTTLGVGCSDPYSAAGENGTQSRLGPRSNVNAFTGVFPYPATWPTNPNATIGRRLQVDEADLNNAGATYWIQGQYITQDDAQAGRGFDNASYRRVTFSAAPSFTPSVQGTTVQRTPVIFAWQANGLGVGVPDPTVIINQANVPGEGRFYVGSRVSDNGDGTWHYEYVVQNLNSDRSGGSFSVPVPFGATITNVGFHAPLYHSNEVFDNTPWIPTVDTATLGGSSVRWDPAPLPVPNPLALQTNALRFATLYNFRFDADVPPAAATAPVTLSLFKPGTPTAVTADAKVPYICAANFNGVGGADVSDIFDFIAAWFAGNPRADFNHSGGIELQDLFDFLAAWFVGC
jgi:hypothetical protein